MNRLASQLVILALLAAACGVALSARATNQPNSSAAPPPPGPVLRANSSAASSAFVTQVNLRPLDQIAVYTEGRVKSFDSFSRAAMQYIAGSATINDQPSAFTYFDLMFRPQAYADQDIVYFRNKVMRAQVAQALRNANVDGFDRQREERFMSNGRLSASLITNPLVIDLLQRLSTDVLRNAKFVDAIANAMSVMDAGALRANLKVVAPPGGSVDDRWLTLDELAAIPPAADSAAPGNTLASKIDLALRDKLLTQWRTFSAAWAQQNAAAVNESAAQLAALLPTVNAAVYPDTHRLAWEAWYFRNYNMTWVWTFYALAMIPLLMSVVFRWRGAHWIGLGLFMLALGLHTFAVMLRWYVAQRWPNSNMFEAITTAAWFGGMLALILELFVARRSGWGGRGLFALGSSVASMTALMAVKLFPVDLSPQISNVMPVLNDIWLYIHTNVIIFSYCLIFIAAVTASMYLIYRAVIALQGRGGGAAEYAKVGGAGSLILTRPDGTSHLDEKRSSLGQILDGTTMIVMEMSFILLWTGLCMGAIWADHSWGRPWGWDPKETFALNTFLVFLVLVHGRLKVKDKGLWTAAMALVGAAVMLFNWIIINFAISGLHSYA